MEKSQGLFWKKMMIFEKKFAKCYLVHIMKLTNLNNKQKQKCLKKKNKCKKLLMMNW